MRFVVVLAAALALAGCAGSSARTWQGRGVSVRVPAGWHATGARLTPVSWPPQFLAVASYPLPHGDRGADGCEPKAAVDALPADGAFIFGWEYTGFPWSSERAAQRAEFPPRPRHFRLAHLGRDECLDHSYLLRFREAGRYFEVHVLLGRKASAQTRSLALGVLDSLRDSRG